MHARAHVRIIFLQDYNLLPQLQAWPPRAFFQRKLQEMLQFWQQVKTRFCHTNFSWKFTVLDLDQVIAQGSIKIEKNRDSFLVVKAIWCVFVFYNHWSCAFQKAIAFLARGWLHKIMVFLKRGLVLCCQSWSLQKNNFVCILIRTESDVIT